MTTRNIVPRADGEGGIGTSSKSWNYGYFKNIDVSISAKAPTPTAGDNSTKIATTAFVNNYLPLSGGTLTGDVNGVTPPNGDNSKKLANTEFIQALASVLVPTGCVQAYAGQTTPQGWLLCDGSAISRTQYNKLFGVIGTSYGAGDGTDTFSLPNLVDKFIQGNAVAGTEKSAGLPNITGRLVPPSNDGWVPNNNNGLFASGAKEVDYRTNLETNPTGMAGTQTFDASRANSIYGNSNTVQPPALTMRYIIKY